MTSKSKYVIDLGKGVTKKVLSTIDDIREKGKQKSIKKLEEKEPETAGILKQVDEIITGGKPTQNPEKF